MGKRVMASGVFDIIHVGHIRFLEEAKKLGDELVVVVARDSTAARMKHRPIMHEEMRRQIVEALKVVDMAVLGHEDDMYATVEEIRPDVIALGYDQGFDERVIEEECRRRGLNVKVVRLPKYENGDLDGTRKIIYRIVDRYDELYRNDVKDVLDRCPSCSYSGGFKFFFVGGEVHIHCPSCGWTSRTGWKRGDER